MTTWPPEGLAATIGQLRTALAAVEFPLELPDAARARARRHELIDRIDDHVTPRLARLDAPLLAVIGGSTGAGKSTLANSLAGRVISAATVRRPTTRRPVLLHHPDDEHWFSDRRILPGLSRVTVGTDDAATTAGGRGIAQEADHGTGFPEGTAVTEIELHAVPDLPRGLAVIDAPDIDSVVAHNRQLAAELLGAADLWIFVTTASRYADEVAWTVLRQAARRGVVMAVVLARVPAGAALDLRVELARRLVDEGLGTAPLFVISEKSQDARGLLPSRDVEHVHSWLTALVDSDVASAAVVRQTLGGAIDELLAGSEQVQVAAEAQRAAGQDLADGVSSAVTAGAEAIAEQLADGTVLRAEVLRRWQEILGTGRWSRGLESSMGRLRDRVMASVRGRPAVPARAAESMVASLEESVLVVADHAEQRLRRTWLAHPAGRRLLDEISGTSPPDTPALVRDELRQWQHELIDEVASQGQDRRTRARMVSAGINATGVGAMLAVFSLSGGLSGAELGIAGGTAVLAQKALEAIFGDQAVRTLAARARESLLDRVRRILTAHTAAYRDVLIAPDSVTATIADLRAAANAVAAAAAGEGP